MNGCIIQTFYGEHGCSPYSLQIGLLDDLLRIIDFFFFGAKDTTLAEMSDKCTRLDARKAELEHLNDVLYTLSRRPAARWHSMVSVRLSCRVLHFHPKLFNFAERISESSSTSVKLAFNMLRSIIFRRIIRLRHSKLH